MPEASWGHDEPHFGCARPHTCASHHNSVTPWISSPSRWNNRIYSSNGGLVPSSNSVPGRAPGFCMHTESAYSIYQHDPAWCSMIQHEHEWTLGQGWTSPCKQRPHLPKLSYRGPSDIAKLPCRRQPPGIQERSGSGQLHQGDIQTVPHQVSSITNVKLRFTQGKGGQKSKKYPLLDSRSPKWIK